MTQVPVAEAVVPRSAMPPVARPEIELPRARAAAEEPPAPEVATEFEELDMMEAEIVELGDGNSRAAASELDVELSAPLEEEVPESAPRPAPAREAAQAELEVLESEPPIKTPPPESGRQVMTSAPPPAVSFREETREPQEADLTGSSDVDSLLEADLSGGPISKAPAGLPTMEQLGDTVELEGAEDAPSSLELDAPVTPPTSPVPADDLEYSPPKAGFSGAYDAALVSPPDANDDLARHDREIEDIVAPAPPSAFGVSAPPSGPVSGSADTLVAPVPVIIGRPAVPETQVAHMVAAAPVKVPETFLELLDVSLSLKP